MKTFKKNKLNLSIIPLSLVNSIKHFDSFFPFSVHISSCFLYKIRIRTHIEKRKEIILHSTIFTKHYIVSIFLWLKILFKS